MVFPLFFFLIVGGIEALLIRSQLWSHNMEVLTNREYNQMFTMHGTTMVFLVIMPLVAAFFNYFMPLQIGARGVAFPRMNTLSLWCFIGGGIILNMSWFFIGGAPAIRWFWLRSSHRHSICRSYGRYGSRFLDFPSKF